MANKPKRKKNRQAFAVPGDDMPIESQPSTSTDGVSVINEGRRWYLIGVFVLIAIGGTYLAQAMQEPPNVPRFTYEVLEKFPHDPSAFTQGLVLEDGFLWESTGKFDGQSSIRKVDLVSGEILNKKKLDAKEFGEGLELIGDKLYQLTWKNGICHVYDKNLNLIEDFKYEGQGWGLAYDGKNLVLSDGSSRLRFFNPDTFEEVRSVTVRNGYASISQLNELEYVDGKIYANRLGWDSIYQIDPKTGQVLGIIDLGGLWENRPPEGVLNGIAVWKRDLVVTGKYCPHVYKLKLLKK